MKSVKTFSVIGSLLMAVLVAAPADAALLRLTPQGLTPSEYQTLGFPLDPVDLASDGFRLTYHGGGQDQLVNPVMLIVALPDLALPAPTITVGATSGFTNVGIDLGDTATRYGGTWNTTTGFAGTFSSASNPKVYDFIGFTPAGSDSENYTNWSGATGFTSWNLFVYALTFTPKMTHGNFAEFDTSLPVGSYVIGYGCEALDRNGKCKNSGSTESTPFTFAGRVTRVPEPSSLGLLVITLAGLIARKPRTV